MTSSFWVSHHQKVMIVFHCLYTLFTEVEIMTFIAFVSCSQNGENTASITSNSMMNSSFNLRFLFSIFFLLESIFNFIDDAWHHFLNLIGYSPIKFSFHKLKSRESFKSMRMRGRKGLFVLFWLRSTWWSMERSMRFVPSVESSSWEICKFPRASFFSSLFILWRSPASSPESPAFFILARLFLLLFLRTINIFLNFSFFIFVVTDEFCNNLNLLNLLFLFLNFLHFNFSSRLFTQILRDRSNENLHKLIYWCLIECFDIILWNQWYLISITIQISQRVLSRDILECFPNKSVQLLDIDLLIKKMDLFFMSNFHIHFNVIMII